MNNMLSSVSGKAIMNRYSGQRRLRSWRNNHTGYFDAVKCHPLAMCRFRPDEGGTVRTDLAVNLAPVNGLMRSQAYVELVQVFVPYQGIEYIRMSGDDKGVTEMTRRRLEDGGGYGLGSANAISRACNIKPKSVGGAQRVSDTIKYAYNAAVNHLRLSAYHGATLRAHSETDVAPAILTANVLERFDGVLDPETLIDGAVNLGGDLTVSGITRKGTGTGTYTEQSHTTSDSPSMFSLDASGNGIEVNFDELGVDLSGASELTLRDMMRSMKVDELVRFFASVRKADPINGEHRIARALYGLSVNYDHNCQVMYRKVFELTPRNHRPMDGPSVNDVTGHFALATSFSTLVPRSELGGQLVTIAMVKPVETIPGRPDPAQTEEWALVNRIHDETELDEELLVRRDLETGLDAVDEDTPVFWVGHNSHLHHYELRGPNEDQTHEVEQKSVLWEYAIPTSVSPENVSYPDAGINMYPFANWSGGHAEYTIDQRASISTHLAKGPSPVERIQLFADDPTLVDDEA